VRSGEVKRQKAKFLANMKTLLALLTLTEVLAQVGLPTEALAQVGLQT
jgi:hypothetical protein